VQNLARLWSGLSLRNRVIAMLASFAVFAAVMGIGRMAAAPEMALLYSGLEPQTAGQIIQALEQQGLAHEVRGGAIYVPRQQRDTLRMSLAAEGLPANNTKGYELLEGLTGFGTTTQMFDAAYWRAKEGELARTIVSAPAITSARVHIAHLGRGLFHRDAKPTASVTITSNGNGLPAGQVKAIRLLVSSAVTGMRPEDVAVIDSVIGLLAASELDSAAIDGDGLSAALRERALRLLEARVGPGNAMVEVNVSTEVDREVITERTLDPGSRVAISTDAEEQSNSSENAGNTAVTVASNLPDGDAQANDTSRSATNQTRERINYEVSETMREIQRGPGKITRVTVAVLVNEVADQQPNGQQVFESRSQTELQDLSDLVASAVGLDANRGDLITIKSMAFSLPAPLGTEVSSGILSSLSLDAMKIFKLLVLATVALIVSLLVLRPLLLSSRSGTATSEDVGSDIRASNAATDDLPRLIPMVGDISTSTIFPEGSNMARVQDAGSSADVTIASSDPVERLRMLIAERQDETVEILRGWLENKSEKV
jgi:flagellar M-ring protein FliF